MSVIVAKDNLFEDLGFDRFEAKHEKIRADLMLDLYRYIQEQGWTQAETAKFFGETQPRISNLLNGDIERFSIDKLVNMLAKAGLRVTFHVEAKATR